MELNGAHRRPPMGNGPPSSAPLPGRRHRRHRPTRPPLSSLRLRLRGASPSSPSLVGDLQGLKRRDLSSLVRPLPPPPLLRPFTCPVPGRPPGLNSSHFTELFVWHA